MKNLLYISMLGEPSLYNVNSFTGLCPSGLEKHWIVEWFQPLVAEYGFSMTSVDICRGDELPAPETVDTLIVGGTSHDIRETFEWLTRLTEWLKEYRTLRRPLLGICGGHQLVATAFDKARLVDRASGLLAGTWPVNMLEDGLEHPLFQGLSQSPKFHFCNNYYVLPSDSFSNRALASIGDNPAIAVDHGHLWYSCQFHPESRKETWKGYFKEESSLNIDVYSEDHDGEKVLENFLGISKAFIVGVENKSEKNIQCAESQSQG